MKQGRLSNRPAFLQGERLKGFLAVVFAGQLAYAYFEAFKGSLMLPLTNALGITMTQYSMMMSALGIATFLYVPGGWINNRFTIRSILSTWLTWRMVTGLILFLVPSLSFNIMLAIAFSWAVWDAIGWPAVTNGVTFMSRNEDSKAQGMAMGLLESIRRAMEFAMNALIILLIGIFPDRSITIMRIAGIAYTVIIFPNILAVLKYVPKNAIAKEEGVSDNVAALKGLVQVIKIPQVWLAGIAGMSLYWCYMNLIYVSAPYMSLVFNASEAVSGAFGIVNTGFLGIVGGAIAGYLADYLFNSSTRMLGVSMFFTALGSFLVYMLPGGTGMWITMLVLMGMSISIFMGKAVILAPIGELGLPDEINGSAMSIGSFFAYASIFWAPLMNANFIENTPGGAVPGYEKVFLTTVIVALVGAIASFILLKTEPKVQEFIED